MVGVNFGFLFLLSSNSAKTGIMVMIFYLMVPWIGFGKGGNHHIDSAKLFA
jgi:hypothetical protein